MKQEKRYFRTGLFIDGDQLTRLPLHTLPTFRLLAQTENMRAAAAQLHLTHSAVSQQIKLLEDQLGAPLFERRGRGVVLNGAGRVLQAAVDDALARLDQGVRAAQLQASGAVQTLRLSVLPSFAHRWLGPRLASWRAAHPALALEIHASQQLVDLQREGFHAGLRSGRGPWRGLTAWPLIDSPLIAVASPQRAARLRLGDHRQLAAEPLLGDSESWNAFLSGCGCSLQGKIVAEFNDAGLMLQSAEFDLGVALARELLAADALRAGRLVRVSPHALAGEEQPTYWLAVPQALAEWPPVLALRDWLLAELGLASKALPAA